ncbi:MAG: hypothetical protein Q4G68_08470 [Planctomycetia bacterium]|nr:hypothetical protein [Planctomycetia bacterium]
MSGTPKLGLLELAYQLNYGLSKATADANWKRLNKGYKAAKSACLAARKNEQTILASPDLPKAASDAWDKGNELFQKALDSYEQVCKKYDKIWQFGPNLQEMEKQSNAALDLMLDVKSMMTLANTEFENARILLEQKMEEIRQHELKRAAATQLCTTLEEEVDGFGLESLRQWCDDLDELQHASSLMQSARQELSTEQFDSAKEHAEESLALFRTLFNAANENKMRAERRNLITKAILEALHELDYDTPAVRYDSASNASVAPNHRLADLTIRANTAGNNGNLFFRVNLDGEMQLEVNNTDETDCRLRVASLAEHLKSKVDLTIQDWGDVSGRGLRNTNSMTKQQIKVQEQTTLRQRQS